MKAQYVIEISSKTFSKELIFFLPVLHNSCIQVFLSLKIPEKNLILIKLNKKDLEQVLRMCIACILLLLRVWPHTL